MKRFEYMAPTSLSQALDFLAHQPMAAPLAGGTNLLVQMKEGHRHENALLSLRRVSELSSISTRPGSTGDLAIGATVTMKQIAADRRIATTFPALAGAAGLIGSVQTRNMATIGGNLCNASPAADTAPPLLAYEAQVVLASTAADRTIPLAGFFTGPGETVRQSGELLTMIIIPAPPPRTGSAYVRHIPRAAMDISVAGVAAVVTLGSDGRISSVRIALGAVAPTPLRAYTAEVVLSGRIPSAAALTEAGAAATDDAQPMDDVRASATYRRHLVNILTQEALRRALAQAEERR